MYTYKWFRYSNFVKVRVAQPEVRDTAWVYTMVVVDEFFTIHGNFEAIVGYWKYDVELRILGERKARLVPFLALPSSRICVANNHALYYSWVEVKCVYIVILFILKIYWKSVKKIKFRIILVISERFLAWNVLKASKMPPAAYLRESDDKTISILEYLTSII